MFDEIFGGGRRGRGGGGRPRAQGYDLETEVELELEEVLTGATREVAFTRLDVCQTCNGSGAKPGTQPVACQRCSGSGQVTQAGLGGMFRMVVSCQDCGGRGSVIMDPCPDCGGRGRVPVDRRIEVKIPAGISAGQAIRIPNEGEPPPPEADPAGEGPRGDLHVVTRVKEHECFERDGDQIVVMPPASPAGRGCGSRGSGLGEEELHELLIQPGTQHGALFRITGAGVPNLGPVDAETSSSSSSSSCRRSSTSIRRNSSVPTRRRRRSKSGRQARRCGIESGRRHRSSLTSKGGVVMRPEDTDMEQPTAEEVQDVVRTGVRGRGPAR